LGLTQEDIETFSQVDGVSQAEGGWSLDGILELEESHPVVKVLSLSGEGINAPVLVSGSLPTQADECVVEEKLLTSYGLSLGNQVTLSLGEDNEDSLVTDTFTITGVVESPLYISIDRGTSSLGDGKVNAYVLLPQESFNLDYYTLCNVTVTGAAALDAYSTEYQDTIDALTDRLTEAAEDRADLRYETLISDAESQIADGQQELDDAKAEADEQIADGEKDLEDARATLDDGWADLQQAKEDYEQGKIDGQQELDDARQELDDGWQQLSEARDTLNQSQAELDSQSASAQAQIASATQQLQDSQAELDTQQAALEESKAQLDTLEQQITAYTYALEQQKAAQEAAEAAGQPLDQSQLPYNQETLDAMNQKLGEGRTQQTQGEAAIAAAKTQIDEGWTALNTQKAQAQAEIDEAQAQINDGWQEYFSSKEELEQGELDYQQGREDYETGLQEADQEISDAEKELEDGEADYAQGQRDLEDARTEAQEKIADGQQELRDAQEQLSDITPADVYVLDRNSNYGFVSYDQNAERMENLAKMFPVIFFIVAALVCLTTMTRMVEEKRTEIGSIKAMGYGTGAIAGKFLLYGALAALGGGIVGVAIGTTLIPWVIFTSYSIMYNLSALHMELYWPLSVGAVSAGLLCTVGATLFAVLSTARETPATLMRPKAPKAGKRILLERIPFLWRHFSFSVKVSCRNLLRYKKRFFMTVIGIAGCTALMIAGLGLRTGIFSIIEIQYGDIYTYNLQLSVDPDQEAAISAVRQYLQQNENVDSMAEAESRTISVTGDTVQDAYLFVTDDPEALYGQIQLRDMDDQTHLDIPEDGVLIDEKLSELLGVQVGDEITLECGTKQQVQVVGILEHYVRHYVYMTDTQYQRLFGETYEPNEFLVTTVDSSDEAVSQLSETLMQMDGVNSATNIVASGRDFEETLQAVNAAVTIIILSAAALALVVLYNLTNINITERIRELATIKVLGFYDGEVAMYIYRENIILTILGIALGQFLGKFLCEYLIRTIEIDLAMFGREAQPQNYLGSIVLSLVFALLVNFMMFFRMKKIDMVESLKSVE
jgi:putative ABC transport system permease protein